jgi:hypothetical protein
MSLMLLYPINVRLKNAVSCVHQTTKSAKYDYFGGSLICRGFYNSSVGFPWSDVGNVHRRNLIQNSAQLPRHISLTRLCHIVVFHRFACRCCQSMNNLLYVMLL